MEILEGKIVAENIKKDFEDKIRILNGSAFQMI